MFRGTLRTKFLLSLALISALLSTATLLVVRYRVTVRVREELAADLRNSVLTFQNMQQQREETMGRSAALLASLPPLKAVMTSQHVATIQDASAEFWKLAGSDLFVLADRSGALMALHTETPDFTRAQAQQLLARSLQSGESRDWWFGGGHLFEVFIQPIYFGSPAENSSLGLIAVGYEINKKVAEEISRAASSAVAFRYGGEVAASTLPAAQQANLERFLATGSPADSRPHEIQLGQERFLSTSVGLSPGNRPLVYLTVLKSFDQATAFVNSLNRWILGIGLAAALAGSLLVFMVSTTFTRPLADLVSGVRALEKGDFAYPLQARGHDEVSALTTAFDGMRRTLRETQQQLIDAERLATIGRMAGTISHDLRHPLTAILANAEFLAEQDLSAAQRKDLYEEIRLAVGRMTEEISSLLGFSKPRETLHPEYCDVAQVIDRAIQVVHARPEFQHVRMIFSQGREECEAWCVPSKLERVMVNLLINSCEAVSTEDGAIEVSGTRAGAVIEIRVADNGRGIPEVIRDSLFQPFVTYGKQEGIGLGLTVVQKIVQDHGGDISVERTGLNGSVFMFTLPLTWPANNPQSAKSRLASRA